MDVKTLPANGMYKVIIAPETAAAGTLTLTLHSVNDQTGSLTVNGGTVAVTLNTPGQQAQLSLADTGQSATVRLTGNTIAGVTVKLMSGTTILTSKSTSSGSFTLNPQTLAADTTYTVVIDPPGANVGNITVWVTAP